MLRLAWNFMFRNKHRWLTVKATVFTVVARLRVRLLPSGRLHRYMGQKGGETPPEELSADMLRHAVWVADRVERVANRLPWENKCLVRAMVAQRLLWSYGICSTLYLGVGRDQNQAMAAHAWVRCGRLYVTGGSGEGYATVATFTMGPQSLGG